MERLKRREVMVFVTRKKGPTKRQTLILTNMISIN